MSIREAPAADPAAECCGPPLTSEPLSAAEAGEISVLLKAIADPARLRLVSLIACHEGGEACVCELTGAFDLTAPTISHHLRVLREAGLISSERRGTWVYYRTNQGVLARLAAVLGPGVPAMAASR
jgi:ArsR family transcriptional regulator